MTVYDDAVKALLGNIPDPPRANRIATLTAVSYQAEASGTTKLLTLWVDLGDGPVPAAGVDQQLMTYILTQTFPSLAGLPCIVAMIDGSPWVMGLAGVSRLPYP